MKVQIDLDTDKLVKLNEDLNDLGKNIGEESPITSEDILDVLERNGIEIV